MHEYSIAHALLTRVAEAAAERQATRVRAVAVRIGELSGVDVELLATAYGTCAAGTVCAEAALEVATVRARWACARCGSPIAEGAPLRCRCGGAATLQQGDEILLERIEIDVDDEGDEVNGNVGNERG